MPKKVLSNFVIEAEQKAFIEELASKTDRKQSSIIREAIDLLRKKYREREEDLATSPR